MFAKVENQRKFRKRGATINTIFVVLTILDHLSEVNDKCCTCHCSMNNFYVIVHIVILYIYFIISYSSYFIYPIIHFLEDISNFCYFKFVVK